jgi:hypothetical protein
LNNVKVGTFIRGVYNGNQRGAMQFICAYRSGSAAWFLGTGFTVGTLGYDAQWNCKVLNGDSLNWSDACACSWTVYLYLKSSVVTVENCKIPTQSEANMINNRIRTNGFSYWTSTKYNDSNAYYVVESGNINYTSTLDTSRGVVPLAKINI